MNKPNNICNKVGYIAGLVLTPVVKLVTKIPMKRALLLVTPVTPLLGGAVLFTVLMNKNLDAAGVDDRAYRLTQNAKQFEVDKISGAGGLAGLSIGVLGNVGVAASLSLGGLGLSSGLIYFFSNKIISKQIAASEKASP